MTVEATAEPRGNEARQQSRWKTAFRLVLALPALLLAAAFGAAGAFGVITTAAFWRGSPRWLVLACPRAVNPFQGGRARQDSNL